MMTIVIRGKRSYPNIVELKIHGIMINPNRLNSTILIIMELKIHMRDLITNSRDDHCDTSKA
jgi:hypothetical protein